MFLESTLLGNDPEVVNVTAEKDWLLSSLREKTRDLYIVAIPLLYKMLTQFQRKDRKAKIFKLPIKHRAL